MKKLIVFLGRSVEGILKDARVTFPGVDVLVVSRDGDQLQPPAEVMSCTVGEFAPDANCEYIVIANGGTTQQLVPVLKKLVTAPASFEVYDLQRDGKSQLW